MSVGHTPGPWRLDYQGGYGKSGVYCDDPLFAGQTLAGVHFPPIYERGETSQLAFDIAEANARLIAAAPELLEALEGDLDWLDALSQETIERDTVLARINAHRSLIARARGEQA